MKKQLVLAAVIALSACAHQQYAWTKPGATQAEFSRDYRECDYEATKAAAGARIGFEQGWAEGTVRRKCMELRGYSWEPKPEPKSAAEVVGCYWSATQNRQICP